MNEFRPLREVFDDVADGVTVDLPDGFDSALLAQALASYCEVAAIEVAEHLEDFTTAVRNHELPDLASGLDLLASVPATSGRPEADHHETPELDERVDPATGTNVADRPSDDLDTDCDTDCGTEFGTDFGTGTGGGDEPDAPGDADPESLGVLPDTLGEADFDEGDDTPADLPNDAGDWWGAAEVDVHDSSDDDTLTDVPASEG